MKYEKTKETIEVNEDKDFTKLMVHMCGKERTLIPKLDFYVVSDFGEKHLNLAVQLFCKSEYGLEPFVTLTKNFGEYIGIKFCAYIDTNNCRFADQLLKQGIAIDTGLTKQSGFCTYPLWQFNEKFLKAVNEEIYRFYSEDYDKYAADEDSLLV